ncbi:hypothetical protein SAMN05216559_0263 [Halomicrobium zhouii]|uniref:Halobacterial output domain-containing protein n=1 Tax=Halomicrobium zhouii TaxID=767519 RepID=A0A1I6K6B5_9EURY|nr:HalOD1 output domain-containing protein [Halomicrobium zhouii]SFR86779.1 hypothetical protein SAMN05216559_0263 [Halomicrobium zhouii]
MTLGDEQAISRAVIETVADATSREETDLPPLFRTIDPEAVDALLAPRPSGRAEPLTLSFEYAGCRVSVERSDADAVAITATVEPE